MSSTSREGGFPAGYPPPARIPGESQNEDHMQRAVGIPFRLTGPRDGGSADNLTLSIIAPRAAGDEDFGRTAVEMCVDLLDHVCIEAADWLAPCPTAATTPEAAVAAARPPRQSATSAAAAQPPAPTAEGGASSRRELRAGGHHCRSAALGLRH